LVMKSEYMPSHCVGIDSTSVVRCVACLYIAVSSAPGDGDFGAWLRGWCRGVERLRFQEAGAMRHASEVMAPACAAEVQLTRATPAPHTSNLCTSPFTSSLSGLNKRTDRWTRMLKSCLCSSNTFQFDPGPRVEQASGSTPTCLRQFGQPPQVNFHHAVSFR
jgi:hypothetical protein